MAAYCYIDSTQPGTEAGATTFSTKQTGSWPAASLCYANTAAMVAANTLTSADFVIYHEGHEDAYSGTVTVDYKGATVLVATSADCGVPVKATTKIVDVTANADRLFIKGASAFYGVYFEGGEYCYLGSGADEPMYWEQCSFKAADQDMNLSIGSGETTHQTFEECDFIGTDTLWVIRETAWRGATVLINGGTSVGNTCDSWLYQLGRYSGGHVIATNHTITGVTDYLVYEMTVGSTLEMDQCTFDSDLPIVRAAYAVPRHVTLLVTRSGDTADVSYQYYYQEGESIAEQSTAYYRTTSAAFEVEADTPSLKIVTSGVTEFWPFWMRLPLSQFCALSSTSTDALKVFILTNESALTDADIHFVVGSRDKTLKYPQERHYSPKQVPWATGTAIPTSTETWNDETGMYEYVATIDTNGDSADGIPEVWICVKKDMTIYIDSQFDVTGV